MIIIIIENSLKLPIAAFSRLSSSNESDDDFFEERTAKLSTATNKKILVIGNGKTYVPDFNGRVGKISGISA